MDDYTANIFTTGILGVGQGGQASGSIETTFDVDWFKISLQAGETYIFDLGGSLPLYSSDSFLQLFDTNGDIKKASFDGGFLNQPQIIFTPSVSGNYFVAARDLFGSRGTYTITASKGVLDTVAPIVKTFSPSDEAKSISVSSDIIFTFNEAISRGTGNIVIKTDDGATVATYAGYSSDVKISGDTLTINPSVNLNYGTGYKVELTAGAVIDRTGNNYAGITSYNFTTISAPDTIAPIVTTFSPADEATRISVGSNIVITFNEAISRGAGNIILKTSSGSTVATYSAATSSNVSISGNALTINPTADLSFSTSYKVEFAAGTIKDLAGNSYSGTTSYNFTTGTSQESSADKNLIYTFKSEKLGAGVGPASYSYFYTVDPAEATYVRGQVTWPWVEKKATFEAAHSNPSESVSVFRFWSDKFQAHFFTISAPEKAQIMDWTSTGKNGYDWKYEGEGFKVYTNASPTDALGKAAIPVYRAWMDDKDFNPSNGLSGGHYFTADKNDYDAMIKLVGVVGEGVAFYGEVPGA